MAFIDTSSKGSTSSFTKGNPAYIMLITMVAALGGLLFGYDTRYNNIKWAADDRLMMIAKAVH